MLCGLYLAFFLGMIGKKWPAKLLAFACAGFMVHVILFSLGRGAMLGLLVSAPIAFALIPKRPQHIIVFLLAAAITLRLAGPMVQERFSTIFKGGDEREESAQSRLDIWRDLWDIIQKNPLLGVGPDHFPLISSLYGWKEGKEGHNTWMQQAAELGLPAASCLVLFYWLAVAKLARLLRQKNTHIDQWIIQVARMVICAVVGFSVAALFATLEGAELPYYVVLLGASALMLAEKSTGSYYFFEPNAAEVYLS
jgi:O-antigen ligase